MDNNLNTELIKHWRSIVTLIVFVATNVIVLFPFHVPIFVPRQLENAVLDALALLRIIQPRQRHVLTPVQDASSATHPAGSGASGKPAAFIRHEFPMNFLTAPVVADLFLLAILAIGREEVSDGIIGTNHIHPYDIMLFFISLAYIAISIDASGLIRFLAFKVLQWGGKVGHKLFFYLYAFFFALGSFIGNDPIILSGTAFLAYMTRVSSNIAHPRAWVYTQFAIANIASATLVSSNPTNLVLAGAFSIRFIDYTANMVVPVVITAIVLFPFLLFIVFADPKLIPHEITMHELTEEAKAKKPVNPNIPNAKRDADEAIALENNNEQSKLLSLEEIMNPFLDKKSATVGAVVMAVTLITLLSLNAAHTTSGGEQPVFYVTLPAATLMLSWDLSYGWMNRRHTREIAQRGRDEVEAARLDAERDRAAREREEQASGSGTETGTIRADDPDPRLEKVKSLGGNPNDSTGDSSVTAEITAAPQPPLAVPNKSAGAEVSDKVEAALLEKMNSASTAIQPAPPQGVLLAGSNESVTDEKKAAKGFSNGQGGAFNTANPAPVIVDVEARSNGSSSRRTTLASLVKEGHTWCRETFPTTMTVLTHLPLALVPFAFAMFILVQALVSSGWVPVFGYGWARWVEKTGTVGAIGGMGFLSVILCNFSGTNIGTTILLCRVVQAWTDIARAGETHITERTFWATVYSMAIGVNYGAFSTAFSASLAGMLWRDILARKHIHIRAVDFAIVNVPIISVAMVVGCVVLIGEVWITRSDTPYI